MSVTAAPRVFFDCQGGPHCDLNYHRTEIPWVSWVRDQQDAQLHVIVTNQNTGAGGREYQMDFMGRGTYEAYLDEVTFQSLPTDTERERLDAVSYALGVGFARFAQHAGFRGLVRIEADEAYLDGGDLPPQGSSPRKRSPRIHGTSGSSASTGTGTWTANPRRRIAASTGASTPRESRRPGSRTTAHS